MSKTWRRFDGHKDKVSGAKKEANRKFRRRIDLDVSNGNWYRKHYPQWDICDWSFTRHIDIQRLNALAPEMDYHDQCYPNGGCWYQPKIQFELPRVRLYFNSDGERRWRFPQGTVLPNGWTFNEEIRQICRPNDKWYNRITVSDFAPTLIWIDHGKPVWTEVKRWKPYLDEINKERETRNFRYTERWPRYHRRDYRIARNMKRGMVSSD